MDKKIQRGDIFWVDWSPGRGSEQMGKRPSLIIQNDLGNKFSSTTIVSSVTTAVNKPYPFLVSVPSEESGLPQDSIVDLAMIMTVNKDRLGQKCGELSPEKMAEVDQAIKVSLGL